MTWTKRILPHGALEKIAEDLWQVTGRDAMDYASRVATDSRYVRNWSIWTDIVILCRTAIAVMKFDQAS